MKVIVKDERTNTNRNIEFEGQTVTQLLKCLNVNPETVLVVKNSEVITEEETLEDNDTIELLSVISGG